MRIGLMFSGQGAQYPGMGKDLYEGDTKAKDIFDRAGDEIKSWCFDCDKETLMQTAVTQPTVYTVTMAAYAAFAGRLKELSTQHEIVLCAGFSLGEYAALTTAGVIDSFEKGLDIVRKRGQWMHEAGLAEDGENKGAMAAAMGDRKAILECVETAREGGILEGVNFNTASQTVVAGDKDALSRFRTVAKEAKLKVIPLKVGSAFHSPMMAPAADKMFPVLLEAAMKAPEIKVYSNMTGRDLMEDFETGSPGGAGKEEEIAKFLAEKMARQVKTPVYWQETVENMKVDKPDMMIEIGPGSTLCGLVKKIDETITVSNIENMETLEQTLALLKG